jgi:hypothetical protein
MDPFPLMAQGLALPLHQIRMHFGLHIIMTIRGVFHASSRAERNIDLNGQIWVPMVGCFTQMELEMS